MKNLKNIEEHKTLLAQQKPIILDFYAEWCPPCKVQIPILESFSNKVGDEVSIVKVNVDEHQDLAKQYGVRSIPTIVMIQDGVILHQKSGVHSEHDLERLLEVMTVL